MMRPFYVILSALVLAGCSQTAGTSLAPAGLPSGSSSTSNEARTSESSLIRKPRAPHGYETIYAFTGGSSSGLPQAALATMNGQLYGTTESGGTSGFGTVFQVSTTGQESLLYSFAGGADGAAPVANLIALNGVLYGTTEEGGTGCGPSGGCGTVFAIDTSGKESVLHSFGSGADGAGPAAGLVALKGELYGTTTSGGYGYGTVFEVSPSGKESVLHAFTGGALGGNPYSSLFALNGALYGTTFSGGMGFGTVFKVTPSGKFSVIYSFQANGTDGENPQAGVIAVNDVLYGTTIYGGANTYGTVFAVSLSGQEQVLTSDVDHPQGTLVAVNGELYGTASYGGIDNYKRQCYSGCGSIFKVSTSGDESLVYDFKGTPDGLIPPAGLVALGGALYGTTEVGGAPNFGTVFKITP